MAPSEPITTAGMTGIRLDAEAVKTLAHPLRSRLLSALRTGGPATATDLASALSTNSGATSYHLRRLESVGLVTDTGDGEGKRRLWRASTESHQWEDGDFVGDEDAETALGWLQRDYSRHLAERYERWLDVARRLAPGVARGPGDERQPRHRRPPSSSPSCDAEVDDVVARYRRVGQGNPAARRVAVYDDRLPARPRPRAPRR